MSDSPGFFNDLPPSPGTYLPENIVPENVNVEKMNDNNTVISWVNFIFLNKAPKGCACKNDEWKRTATY